MTALEDGPKALIEIAIQPKAAVDRDRLVAALVALADDDPWFEVQVDEESSQTIIAGQTELHLDVKVDMLRRHHGIEVELGAPRAAYRETLTRRIDKDYTHKRQAGGIGQFARVKLVFEPNEAGSAFESRIIGGAVPNEFIPGVERGIRSVMGSGVRAGFPVVDIKATLIDGAYHDVDSSALAFEIAARAAFREVLREGGSILLEPIMAVEVIAPEEYVGSVRGDLVARRGEVRRVAIRDTLVAVDAQVPLANLLGYAHQLRSLTQGFGHFTMTFSHYAATEPVEPDDPPCCPAVAMRAA